MNQRPYQTSRLIQLIVSASVLVITIFLIPLSLRTKISVLFLGACFGLWLGLFDWKKTRARIDQRNVVVLYASDGAFYFILFLLFLVQAAPKSIFTFSKIAANYSFWFYLIIVVICSIWAAYDLAYWKRVRDYELAHGLLFTKQFWSRSKIGQEGMISKEGIVVDECNPTGKVKISSILWNAESIDGVPIFVDERIIVRDIEGLKVIVEKIT